MVGTLGLKTPEEQLPMFRNKASIVIMLLYAPVCHKFITLLLYVFVVDRVLGTQVSHYSIY